REGGLSFHKLFVANPHIFISSSSRHHNKKFVTLDNLHPYPYLSYEQGDYNSFYFSEEILSTLSRPKNIRVTDRATLFNLLIGLNGYTISTGVISKKLNGENIISVPLQIDEQITVGYIAHKNISLSPIASIYIDYLKESIHEELKQI